MSISDNYSPLRIQGNGSTTQYSASWQIFKKDCLIVDFESSTDPNDITPQSEGSDYTVTFDESGFVVTFFIAPPNTVYVRAYRQVDIDQTNPYRTAKGFQGEVIEQSFDKVTAICQYLEEGLSRSLTFPIGGTGFALPNPEPNKAWKWNSSGTAIINSDNDPDELVNITQGYATTAQNAANSSSSFAGQASGYANDAFQSASDAFDSENNAAQYASDAQVAKMEWRGAWSAGTYQARDVVGHNGSSWIATSTTTEEPSIVATDWDLVALKGIDGSGGVNSVNSISPDLSGNVELDAEDIPFDKAGTDFAGEDVDAVLREIDTDFAKLDRAQSFSKGQASAPVALTMGATVNVDLSLSNYFTLQIASTNFTLANPTNAVKGTSFIIDCTQDPTTARVMTLGSNYITQDGKPIVIPSTLSGNFLLYGLVDKNNKIKISQTPIWSKP